MSNPVNWAEDSCVTGQWRSTKMHLSVLVAVTFWLRPFLWPGGQWHKTCHPELQPGPRQQCSYVNVSACADSRAWHISLNMHVRLWPRRHKHPCMRDSAHLHPSFHACVPEQLLECYSDIPSGKEAHDCCRLLDCPYPFRSTGDVEVTSDFIHTQLGFSLSVHIFSPVTQVCCTAPVTGSIYCFSLFSWKHIHA